MAFIINRGKKKGIFYIPSGGTVAPPPAPSFSSTKSLDFDGIDDYVNVGNIPSLNNASAFSISAWVKFGNIAIHPDNRWFGIIEGTATTQWISGQLNSNGDIYFVMANGTLSYGGFEAIVSGKIVSDTYYHLVMVFDGSQTGNANKMQIYLNSVSETLTFGGTIPTTSFNFTDNASIGWDGYGSIEMLGNVDEVSIFNTALTQLEVTSIYNDGVPTNLSLLATPPTNWYRMGENSTFSSPQILMPENTNKDKFSNYSLDFDGVTSYIDTSDATLVNGYTDVTFSGWINVSSLAANFDGILCSRSGSDYILIHIGNIVGSTYTLYIQQQNGGGGTYTITYTLSLNFDSWYHFAIMGSVGGKWDMYINGSNSAQVQGSNTIGGITQALSFKIGKDTTGRELVGKIDEVSIFNEVKAIGDLWDGTGQPTDLTGQSGLVSWWRMGEEATFDAIPTEWTIPDQAGSNDGTSANMDIYTRIGDAPDSPNNALSYNMDAADIVEDTP